VVCWVRGVSEDIHRRCSRVAFLRGHRFVSWRYACRVTGPARCAREMRDGGLFARGHFARAFGRGCALLACKREGKQCLCSAGARRVNAGRAGLKKPEGALTRLWVADEACGELHGPAEGQNPKAPAFEALESRPTRRLYPTAFAGVFPCF
jgi:hypothetical protein